MSALNRAPHVVRLALPLLILITWFATACGGGDSSGTPAPVATVTVTPNPATVTAGSTLQLTATLEDADGNELSGRTITWSSSAAAIATVDANGLVTGVADGPASISAASEGRTGSTALSVTPTIPGGWARSLVGPGGKDEALFVFLFYNDDWVSHELPFPVLPGGTAGTFFGSGSGVHSPASAAWDLALMAGGYGGGSVVAGRQAMLFNPVGNEGTALEMVAARVGHTMTMLSGSRALIAGGDSGTIGGPGAIVTLSSAEIFDLASMEFAATGSMAEARRGHAAALLPDGRVLVTGGLVPVSGGPGSDLSATTEIFDPVSGTFTPGPDMGVARAGHTATALGDGRVLVLGGNGQTGAEVYDPVGNEFVPVGDMVSVHREGHQAVRLPDGEVLVLGGDAGVIQPSAVAELFDPATGEFTRIDDMTTTRMRHFALLLQDDGTVLIGGGQDASGDVVASAELYDPGTGTFTPVEDMPLPGTEQAAAYIGQ